MIRARTGWLLMESPAVVLPAGSGPAPSVAVCGLVHHQALDWDRKNLGNGTPAPELALYACTSHKTKGPQGPQILA